MEAIQKDKNRLESLRRVVDEFQGKTDILRALAANRSVFAESLEAIRRSLPKGAWLRSVKARDVSAEGVTSFAIEGLAFENDLEDKYRSGAVGMDKFTKALVEQNPTLFASVDDLRSNVNKDLREFSFVLRLAAPIGQPTALRQPAAPAAEEE